MTDKSVIIIGAGIAGLSAGCYAQMNGYRAAIFELHTQPGGLCTAWERKGYTFDGCIHYLFGSGEGRPFNRMWQELGAVQGRPMIDHDEYQRITDGEHTLIVYADPDRLEAHLLEISPQDAPLIRAFCKGVRQFTTFDMSLMYEKPKELMSGQDWGRFGLKMRDFIIPLARWATLSTKDFAARFKHPFLRRAITQMFSWEEAPVMMGMALLAYMHTGNAGFPVGGSLAFSRAIERRFRELGGEVHYDAQVEKILVKDGRAVGVRLYNDEVYHADYVISASDGRTTIYDLLDGQFINRKLRRMYDGHLPMHSQVQVSLGVSRDLSGYPHWVTHLLEEPLLIIGEERRELGIKHYCFDPTLAPAGKSVVEAMIRSSYTYWQNLFGRRIYDTEQRQVSGFIIDLLEKQHPGISGDIEHVDEATPLSYERFTNNWMGATSGWLLTRETMPMMIRGVDKRLPGLRNFLMAGQWVEPGGSVPLAAASGRCAVQIMCHEDGRPFETHLPA
ncbi:MAG: FAD-dependent oxidoreductase [Anaerolineae bacterium]